VSLFLDFKDCIFARRDTRHFLPDAVPEKVLLEAFEAAHCAPSVGLSEPWRFVVVESQSTRKVIYDNFLNVRNRAQEQISSSEALRIFSSLKLEALRDAPVIVGVFCEMPPPETFTIGVQGTLDTVTWSCACAIQNFWLSLTNQGYSAGWVSILDFEVLSAALNIPNTWKPMGIMCVGKPATNYDKQPMLQKLNWKTRSLNPVVIKV
jgi:5,6-dimethylbenzimidazole synthase